jgi:outer membrane receptor for ferrienterochelin and colicin
LKKRSFIALITLFLVSLDLICQERDFKITWNYDGQDFNEFVKSAESSLNVKFFYRPEWVKDIRFSKFESIRTLPWLLDTIFKGKKLYWLIDKSGNIILTKDYKVKTPVTRVFTGDSFIPKTDYSIQNDEKKFVENLLMEVGNPAEKNRTGNVLISGYVKSKDSKEPVIGATVFIKELATGTITNEYGFYSINIPRGNYYMRFTYVGMKETAVNASVYGPGKLDVEMKETLIPLKETVVTADRSNVLQRFEVGLEKLNMRTFRLMPTSMGETDILKGMLLIPGVKTIGEGSSGFNVRGGSADQNLILLYGEPVFNTSHFFGFFSAVNSDIIKDVLLYKGGIPAQYGGRISSVLDIISKDGNKQKLTGNAGISPITTHLLLEVPLIKEKLSLVLAGRTTYSNWILGLINNQALRNSKASFYDFNGKLVYDINNNNKLELSSYLSNDAFRFNSDTTYNYKNQILSLKWRHTVNSNLIFFLSAGSSVYNYSLSSKRVAEDAFTLKHNIGYSNLKADFNWYRINNHRFNFGMDINRYNVLPGEYLPASDSSLIATNIIEKEKAIEGALYAEDKIRITDKLSINIGVRFSLFSAIGPHTIMLYDPTQPRTQSSVTDTLNINSGKFYKTYAGPEYRISVNYKLSEFSSLKLNYNRTRQYLHLLSNTTSISPTDTWKLSDYYLKPQIGDQYALGYYLEFPKQKFEMSAEIYYKNIRDMIDFKGGTNLIMNKNIEKDVINVEGKAYGLELMLKKSLGKLNWTMSYTYSRTLVRSITEFSTDAINGGNWFPASYDKPHDVSMMLSFLLTRRFSFSVNYTYNTGRPITYPVAVYQNNNMTLIEFSDRNKYRIPDYSRFDISARISGNLRSHKLANPFWTFSVFNLFGRENVYSVYFKTIGTQVRGYRLSIFARAIPTLTYSFDF